MAKHTANWMSRLIRRICPRRVRLDRLITRKIAATTPDYDLRGEIGRAPVRSDPWAEDPDYPRFDWRAEVCAGDTSLGYWDWVAHQRESL